MDVQCYDKSYMEEVNKTPMFDYDEDAGIVQYIDNRVFKVLRAGTDGSLALILVFGTKPRRYKP